MKLPWILRGGDFSRPGWHTEPTAAYQLMFEFLRVSPSYELARKARLDRLKKSEHKQLPPDFDEVLQTYDLLGDVNCVLFRQWWLKRGLHVFGNPYSKPDLHEIFYLPNGAELDANRLASSWLEGLPDKRREEGLSQAVIISLPLSLKKSEILKKVRKLIERYKEMDQQQAYSPVIKLMGKRFHANPTFNGLRLLWFRSAKPDWELWRLGAKAKISESYSRELNPAGPRKTSNPTEVYDREVLSKITYRSLDRFERIAENAARGKFLCADPVDKVEFNYPVIAQRLSKHWQWVKTTKKNWHKKSDANNRLI